MKRLFPLALILILLVGCAASGQSGSSDSINFTPTSTSAETGGSDMDLTATALNTSEAVWTYQDVEIDSAVPDDAVVITLSDDHITATGGGATINASTVLISVPGAYRITGTLSNGQLVVDTDTDGTVQLFLDDVTLTNLDGPALLVENADLTVLTLLPGTSNTLTDGAEHSLVEEDDLDGTIYARDDLVIQGTGNLEVLARYENGIVAKDSLALIEGTLTVNAENNGIRANDQIEIYGGTYTIDAGNDGIKSGNDDATDSGYLLITGGTFTITSGHDAIQAAADLLVTGGTFELTTGGGSDSVTYTTQDMGFNKGFTQPTDGAAMPQRTRPGAPGESTDTVSGATVQSDTGTGTTAEFINPFDDDSDDADSDSESDSYKGIKSGGTLTLAGGTLTIDAQDDTLHSNTDILILGGSYTLASGDDGVHADGTLQVQEAQLMITQSYEGLEGAQILIQSGDIEINAADDGINVSGSTTSERVLTINGGNILVVADGDGIDSNGSFIMNGGSVTVNGPTSSGNNAIDVDGTYAVNGGSLAGYGSSGMATSPTESDQGVINLYFDTFMQDVTVTVWDDAGNNLYTYSPEKPFQHLTLSVPSLSTGSTYTVQIDGIDDITVDLSDMIVTLSQSGEVVQNPTGMGHGTRR